MSMVRLFFGAFFILSEFTDIYFEVKAEHCFEFYAFSEVFQRNGIVLQNRTADNCFALARNVVRKYPPPFTVILDDKIKIIASVGNQLVLTYIRCFLCEIRFLVGKGQLYNECRGSNFIIGQIY